MSFLLFRNRKVKTVSNGADMSYKTRFFKWLCDLPEETAKKQLSSSAEHSCNGMRQQTDYLLPQTDMFSDYSTSSDESADSLNNVEWEDGIDPNVSFLVYYDKFQNKLLDPRIELRKFVTTRECLFRHCREYDDANGYSISVDAQPVTHHFRFDGKADLEPAIEWVKNEDEEMYELRIVGMDDFEVEYGYEGCAYHEDDEMELPTSSLPLNVGNVKQQSGDVTRGEHDENLYCSSPHCGFDSHHCSFDSYTIL